MKLVQANAKWLAALACGVMLAGARQWLSGKWGTQESTRKPATCVDFPKSFAMSPRTPRPSIVTILTTGKPQTVRMPI